MSQNLILECIPEVSAVSSTQTSPLFVVANVTAPAFEQAESESRAPVDICAVIDVSGSMAGDKLDLVQQTISFMITQLKSSDRLGLVSFDTAVYDNFPLSDMTDSNKKDATKATEELADGSSTNLSGGLLRGLEVIKARQSPRDVASVLLFTDGQANHGITDTAGIVAAVQASLGGIDRPVSIFTFGFGSDHDAEMLRSISEAGHGMYYYVENEDAIPQCFADCLGGLLSVCAQNIQVKIEAQGNVLIKQVFGKYKTVEQTPGKVFTVSIPDLYGEEKRDIVLLTEVPPTDSEGPSEILKVSLECFNVLTTNMQQTTCSVTVDRLAHPPAQQISAAVDKQKNRVETAAVLDRATALGNQQKLEEARKLVTDQIEKLKSSVSSKDQFVLDLIEDLEKCLSSLQSSYDYETVGSRFMTEMAVQNMYQRGAGVSSKSAQVNRSKAKSAMVSDFSSHVSKKSSSPSSGSGSSRRVQQVHRASFSPQMQQQYPIGLPSLPSQERMEESKVASDKRSSCAVM